MAIEIQELNEWINSDEGRRWGDEYKSALLKNRDTLLSELKSSGAKLSDTDQRLVQTENELSAERAALSKFLIDNELGRLLKNVNVVETLIPAITNDLKNAYGITVKASGDDRTATGKLRDKEGNEIEATLSAIVDVWKELPESKQVRLNVNTGGGATGSTGRGWPTGQPDMNKLSGRQLANTSDSDFEAWRQQELNKQSRS
jgi:hypothetical protein